MTEYSGNYNMTCGEYLHRQRMELTSISDLSAPGAVDKAENCLSNIYAVSYQMNFERREPPSPHRGPAENELLDPDLVREMSDGVRNKVNAFREIKEDPGRLSQAMICAQRGNGFQLIEMVNTAFLARRAGAQQAAGKAQAEAAPAARVHQAVPQMNGPVL